MNLQSIAAALLFVSIATGEVTLENKPIVQSHEYDQAYDGLNEHTYMSDVGQPSEAPRSNAETHIQYLSGTDKDHTVKWDFYCTSGRNSAQWATIPVPSNWEMQGFGKYTYGDAKSGEKGIYNHMFRVPASWKKGKRVFIVFESVSLETTVYINGKATAEKPHAGGYYRFSYDVTDLLDYQGVNLLEVYVDNDSSTSKTLVAAEGGDYWRFGGIYRPVYLAAYPEEHIERCAIDAKADGTLTIDVFLQNVKQAKTVSARITTLSGEPVGAPFSAPFSPGRNKVTLSGSVKNPLLWNAETPNLYRLELNLEADGTQLHTTNEHFGFRTVEVRPGKGLFVNGTKVIIKGVNRHSTWPDSGKTLSDEIHDLDIDLLKAMNMNAVRTCHYPPDIRFLELCDEKGVYVLDEFGSCQNKMDKATGEPLVKAFVMRDVNHPSVLFWSNGNEGGHNPELDPFFKEIDIQKRPVIYPRHGRTPVDGIITDHYEPYRGIEEIIKENKIYIATELAHGLYDGGAGAGFDDYWRLIMSAPLTQGCFVWNLFDEGILRTDQNKKMDTAGNQAPDGILSPYRKKEGSFYTLREILSPVHINMRELPVDFNGSIPIENRYNFTNTDQCRFTWQLVNFRKPGDKDSGYETMLKAAAARPSIAPGTNPDFHSGHLDLELPSNWRNYDALLLTALDPYKNEIFTWSWVVKSAREFRESIVRRGEGKTTGRIDNDRIIVTAAGVQVEFDTKTGNLAAITRGGISIPFNNGPVLCTGTQECSKVSHYQDGDDYVVEATYTGNMKSAKWTMLPSGWLELEYHYNLTDKVPFMGISFDYPEASVKSMKWLGRGPFRVWKNRLKGGTLNVWNKHYNQTATGDPDSKDAYDYPEFKGYHADTRWVVLNTKEGAITIVSDDESMFFRNFTPEYGRDAKGTDIPFPVGNISFLDGINPQSTKISSLNAPDMGPQGEPNEAKGDYSRTLYFRF